MQQSRERQSGGYGFQIAKYLPQCAAGVTLLYQHYRGTSQAGARSGIGLSVVGAVTLPDGRAISSSAIRKALTRGDTALAQRMLGRPVTQAMKDIFFSINRETEKVEEGFA